MNTQSEAISSSAVERHTAAPVVISPVQRYLWSVRREFWENRSIYIAPLAGGALTVFAFLISMRRHLLPDLGHAAGLDPVRKQALIQQPYDLVAGAMMLIVSLVAAFYCLDALYGERRDRSILFWKSLPVSDLTAVLAKVSVPLLILPVIGWAVALVAQLVMALVSSIVRAGSGVDVAGWWAHLPLFRMSILLLYHLITVHAIWWAPFFGWFLLVSAWARRAPILWAVLPPLAISLVEKIVFGTSYFLGLLQYRLYGESHSVILPTQGMFPTHPMTHMTPLAYLSNPGLWTGLAITAVFLAGAVRLRRYREPI
jgi:ABC-2 type transport system permease protein